MNLKNASGPGSGDEHTGDEHSSDTMSPDELQRLVNSLLDDQLDPREAERLHDALNRSHAHRELYLELTDLHASLAWQRRWPLPIKAVFAASELHEEDLMQVELDQLKAKPFPIAPDVMSTEHPFGDGTVKDRHAKINGGSANFLIRNLRLFVLPIAIAATLLIVLSVSKWMVKAEPEWANRVEGDSIVLIPFDDELNQEATPISKRPAPIAILTSSAKARWRGDAPIAGDVLYSGDSFRLENGQALISFGFGAEMLATAPCQFSLVSKKRIQLTQGKVFVNVANWGRGFTVVTDTTRVVDLGTTFTVSVDAGVTETSVQKGKVRLHLVDSVSGGALAMLVPQGQGVSVDPQSQHQVLPNVASQVPRDLGFGTLAPFQTIPMPSTGIGLSEGDIDSNWHIVARRGEVYEQPEPVRVCVADSLYLSNDPGHSQWISMSGWRTADIDTVYTFKTRLNFDGYDLASVRFFCRLLGDDRISAVRINGQKMQTDSWIDDRLAKPKKVRKFGVRDFDNELIEVTNALKTTNVIEVDVHNAEAINGLAAKSGFSPMALRVQWYAFGRKSSSPE